MFLRALDSNFQRPQALHQLISVKFPVTRSITAQFVVKRYQLSLGEVSEKKNGKSLCIACHLYARTMLIFSVLLKLTDVLPRTSFFFFFFFELKEAANRIGKFRIKCSAFI